MLGGGSNLVVADEGFAGTVVEVATRGHHRRRRGDDPTCGGVVVDGRGRRGLGRRRGAPRSSDGWVGVEALSGIPGSVGATPIQNVGAYGQEVSQTVARVRVWDRATPRRSARFAAADCGFGYRTSRFKADPSRHVVLEVTFQFRQGELGAPVAYAELARTLGVEPGARAPMTDVRACRPRPARAARGWCSTRPTTTPGAPGRSSPTRVLDGRPRLPEGAPRWPQPDGSVKTSAAWLIEQAGFGKGYGDGRGAGCRPSTPWR